MGRSIMQETRECYLCRKEATKNGYYGQLRTYQLHRHHVIFGRGYRELSEKYGLWVYLCQKHHTEGQDSVHKNKKVNVALRIEAEKAFLREHTFQEWMQLFTRNYLDENEINRIMTEQRAMSETKNTETKPSEAKKTLENRIMTKAPPDGFFFIE